MLHDTRYPEIYWNTNGVWVSISDVIYKMASRPTVFMKNHK